jgi:hypothetical protein
LEVRSKIPRIGTFAAIKYSGADLTALLTTEAHLAVVRFTEPSRPKIEPPLPNICWVGAIQSIGSRNKAGPFLPILWIGGGGPEIIRSAISVQWGYFGMMPLQAAVVTRYSGYLQPVLLLESWVLGRPMKISGWRAIHRSAAIISGQPAVTKRHN